MLIILQSLAITRLVPIPRRKVEPEAEAGVLGGGGQVGDNIAGPIPPLARPHRVIGILRGPQGEAVVVFRSQNYSRKSGFFGNSNPLSSIELRRVEHGRVGTAQTPFRVREGVHSEVQEHGHFAKLPLELESGGDGQNGKRRSRWLQV